MSKTGDLITRVYGNFRGVDFRGEEVNLSRSPDSLNMWKDYTKTDAIRTRPGMEQHTAFTDKVYGVFFYNGNMMVHSGTNLYKVESGEKSVLFSGIPETESNAFVYDGIWYFKDGVHYLKYDGSTIGEVVGYIPTTSIGRKPAGGGTTYEDVNLLTGKRINTFLADGGSFDFYLDTKNIDSDYPPIVKVNDEVVSGYTVDYTEGKITFTQAPDAPLTDGQDNVRVEFRKTIEGYSDLIRKCTMLQPFDNRVFFSGNPDYPNTIWHCSLNDPSYCSDLDFYKEGMDTAKVTGMVSGNNALWVFREPSDANTTVFYHNPVIDDTYGKIYPSSHSSVTLGCVGKAINFNDDIVFFSERGMEGVSGDITTEQVASHRSSTVDRKLIAETNYTSMLLEEWNGYLCVFIDDKCYLADSKAMYNNTDHAEYDWFFWKMSKPITCARVQDGVLYLGTADGVYTLTDNESPLESYWTTPKDKFNSPYLLKTTNKRGCVAEALGDVQVYAKLEDTDFEKVGTFENVTDYFVGRIKKKKFKDIQLKFYSQTRFSLETVTLGAWIGGYIKR